MIRADSSYTTGSTRLSKLLLGRSAWTAAMEGLTVWAPNGSKPVTRMRIGQFPASQHSGKLCPATHVE
jgi:hypothetical protein